MREIVFDTETTGFEPSEGHRIVEIGCIELMNHIATGRTFHHYIHPDRDIPEEVVKVHGIDNAKVANCPRFHQIVDEWLAFVEDAPLIAHNAGFDMKFVNAELTKCGRPPLPPERFIDTLPMARRRFPGAPASLDALCKRFGIDNSHREKHGALLDSELLAEVYLELRGGREPGLALTSQNGPATSGTEERPVIARPDRAARPHGPSPEEAAAHAAFLAAKVKKALWLADAES